MRNKIVIILRDCRNRLFCKNTIKWIVLLFIILGLAIPTLILTANEPDWIYISSPEELSKMNDDLSASYYIRNKQFTFSDSLPQIGSMDKPFTGRAYFDGTNIVFSNIEKKDDGCYGLFAYNKGTISGLSLYSPSITVDSTDCGNDIKLGFICCVNEGTIKNCTTNVHSRFISEMENNSSICGTICAINKGVVSNCFCYGSVNDTNYYSFGGISALNERGSTIDSCYVSTQYVFNGIGPYSFGGVVCELNDSKITNCCIESRLYYGKDIYNKCNPSFGGIACYVNGSCTIGNCYSHIEPHFNFDVLFGATCCELRTNSTLSLCGVLSNTRTENFGTNFSHSVLRPITNNIIIDRCFYTTTNVSDELFFPHALLDDELFEQMGWPKNIWSFDSDSNSIVFIRTYR